MGVNQNGQTPNIIGICSYCVPDRPVFEWNQVLLHPGLTPWWSFRFADGAHHKKPHSPTHHNAMIEAEHKSELDLPKTPHTSPVRARYGLSFVNDWEKMIELWWYHTVLQINFGIMIHLNLKQSLQITSAGIIKWFLTDWLPLTIIRFNSLAPGDVKWQHRT